MSQLSKQSIRALCDPHHRWVGGPPAHPPMIYPFNPDKVRVHGVSSGLSHASYDAAIAHDLVLGRHPGYVIREWVLGLRYTTQPGFFGLVDTVRYFCRKLMELQRALVDEPPAYALASTVEDFNMPTDVSAQVCDKSTFARVFVSAFNTFFDPGFCGNATLELVNLSDQRVEYKAGQGVCQFIFTYLDKSTESPYDGKYQGQAKGPQGPRWEPDAGAVPKHQTTPRQPGVASR